MLLEGVWGALKTEVKFAILFPMEQNSTGGKRPRVCLTSGVFRWLCDIHAVRQEHGEGYSAGGIVLTDVGAQVTMGGSLRTPAARAFLCSASMQACAAASNPMHCLRAPTIQSVAIICAKAWGQGCG